MPHSRSSRPWTSRRGGEGAAGLGRLLGVHEGQPPRQGHRPGRRGGPDVGRRRGRAAVRLQAGTATRAEPRGAAVLSRKAIRIVHARRPGDRRPLLQDHGVAESKGTAHTDKRRLDRSTRDGDRRGPGLSGQSLRAHRPGRMGERDVGLRAARPHRGVTAWRV